MSLARFVTLAALTLIVTAVTTSEASAQFRGRGYRPIGRWPISPWMWGVAAAIAIPVWLFWYRAARDAWLTLALGCVMGGILGNLFDRMGLHGEVWPAGDRAGETIHAVRDWILWQVNDQWTWPNFNIADSLLVTGAVLMFLHALWQPRPVASEPEREKAASGNSSACR